MFIFLAIIVVIIILIILFYNVLIHSRNVVNNSKSLIDVYLQQRFDLIPNLISVTKEYSHYEQDVLNKISELRSFFKETKDSKASAELNNHYLSMIATIEKHPDLKANDEFLNLQKNLSKVESQLQAARRLYNNDVTKYNTKIHSFPINILAMLFGFKEMPLFELDGEKEIKIEF